MKNHNQKELVLFKMLPYNKKNNNLTKMVLLFSILICLSFAAILTSCRSDKVQILGVWQSTEINEPPHTINFDRNGEALLRDADGLTVSVFTYEMEGNQLTLINERVETTWTVAFDGNSLTIDAGGLNAKYNKVK